MMKRSANQDVDEENPRQRARVESSGEADPNEGRCQEKVLSRYADCSLY